MRVYTQFCRLSAPINLSSYAKRAERMIANYLDGATVVRLAIDPCVKTTPATARAVAKPAGLTPVGFH